MWITGPSPMLLMWHTCVPSRRKNMEIAENGWPLQWIETATSLIKRSGMKQCLMEPTSLPLGTPWSEEQRECHTAQTSESSLKFLQGDLLPWVSPELCTEGKPQQWSSLRHPAARLKNTWHGPKNWQLRIGRGWTEPRCVAFLVARRAIYCTQLCRAAIHLFCSPHPGPSAGKGVFFFHKVLVAQQMTLLWAASVHSGPRAGRQGNGSSSTSWCCCVSQVAYLRHPTQERSKILLYPTS